MTDRFEPGRATFERWLEQVASAALDEVEGLAESPAAGPTGPEGYAIGDRVSLPIPEEPYPGGMTDLLARLREATAASLNTAGPGYLAYIPGGGLPVTALAELYSNLCNRYTGVSAAAPALCRLEADVLGWLARQFGYDERAHGLLTSGGSLAILSGVITARHDRLGDEGDYSSVAVYTSTQAHHAVAKAVSLAGIPARSVRSIDVDDQFRMDVDALVRQIGADRAAGVRPFLVVSAAGTTNTGAVDPLAPIADVCEAHGLWHHVDGAYGGAFVLCPEGRTRLSGIERADSITFDPHKGMFLPLGTGCLLVRDAERLRRAHGGTATYLQDFDAVDRTGEPPSPSDYGPELSRGYRGLRLWLPLTLYGAGAFRRALSEKLELAERFHRGLQEEIDTGLPVEIVAPPQLSIVPFRLRRGPGESLPGWNARNAGFLAAINRRRHVHLSSTLLPVTDGEAFTLRVSILSFRTHAARVDTCLRDVVESALGYTPTRK
jgi:aromatic-L-amino-acid decarboxylase